jgi:predicted alpha-1,2-mannosidase
VQPLDAALHSLGVHRRLESLGVHRCLGRQRQGTPRGGGAVLLVVAVSTIGLSACGPSSERAGSTNVSSLAAATTVSPAPSALVDPFMGTGTGGASVGNIDEFPAADMPFGMVQWGPDTIPDRAFGGGYTYGDSAISGFSLTHLSGPGCAIYGDIPILPLAGSIGVDPTATTSAFSHTTEVASPGNYAVTLGQPAVRVQLAVTTRAALGRFSFPAGVSHHVLFKVADSANGSSRASVSIVGDREVEGSVTSGQFCNSSGSYTLFFAARFDQPFSGFGTWHNFTVEPGTRTNDQPQSGGYVTFSQTTRQVELQVGVSFVSVANAWMNLDAEPPGWNLGALERRATRAWNQILGRIDVGGGSVADERTFYSALYHSLLHPNVFDDANGQYVGFDGKVHVATGYTQYANFSEWDIYRCEVPLLALVAPGQAGDMVTSLLADAAQGGGLPKWAIADSESAQMNGDSADPVIAAAYAFGARNFDVKTALAYMVKGATDPAVSNGGYPERQDLAQYLAKGYVQADSHDLTSSDYTVGGSETLEYAIDDFAISQLASATGDIATEQTFLARAQNWRNLGNPAVGYLGARQSNGAFPPGPAFVPSPQPDSGQDGFEEGNAIQYTWSVPQNLHGLFDALGGNGAVITKLDDFFTKLNTSRKQPYDWAGNEPSLGIPWEYDYAGAPWRTQRVVRRIATTLYSAAPDGEPGNDDLGAMSSWYVWAAIGMYPETPGRGELALGSPLFPHVSLSLQNGRSITIDAPGASPAALYVRALTVDGVTGAPAACGTTSTTRPVSYSCAWLPASTWATGARLDFSLGGKPNADWAATADEAPPSFGPA